MPAEAHTFHSAALGNQRNIWIRSPRAADSAQPLPLLLFLDGEIFEEEMDADRLLEELEDAGRIPPALAVFVSHRSMEDRLRECPCHPPLAECILKELLPWLEDRHSLSANADDRTIFGVSYTGLAAAFIALEGQGRIGRVVSQSGSFWSEDGRLIDRFGAEPLLPIRFYLEVGTEETQDYLEHNPDLVQLESQLHANRRMHDALVKRHYEVDYREVPGSHHPNSWRQTLPDTITWALAKQDRS